MNGDEAAFPPSGNTQDTGLTKRELFAAMAMQGLRSFQHAIDWTRDDIAVEAVRQADALIEALAKPKAGGAT